jgi:hypothetical protein
LTNDGAEICSSRHTDRRHAHCNRFHPVWAANIGEGDVESADCDDHGKSHISCELPNDERYYHGSRRPRARRYG